MRHTRLKSQFQLSSPYRQKISIVYYTPLPFPSMIILHVQGATREYMQ